MRYFIAILTDPTYRYRAEHFAFSSAGLSDQLIRERLNQGLESLGKNPSDIVTIVEVQPGDTFAFGAPDQDADNSPPLLVLNAQGASA